MAVGNFCAVPMSRATLVANSALSSCNRAGDGTALFLVFSTMIAGPSLPKDIRELR
jgi:hypothetical protein